jgi:hypothetical protein
VAASDPPPDDSDIDDFVVAPILVGQDLMDAMREALGRPSRGMHLGMLRCHGMTAHLVCPDLAHIP